MNACATLWNAKTTRLKIVTSEPGKLIVNDDTLTNPRKTRRVLAERDKKPLLITAYNDSVTKTVSVKYRISFSYWVNSYPGLWPGFLIDTKTKRKYTYPKTVYIDFAAKDSTYLTYKPLSAPYNQYKNIIKTTPLKLIDLVNPGMELSYEQPTGRSFSTQIMASYLLPYSLIDAANDFNPGIKGFRGSIEEKYYIEQSAPIGMYFSAEFNYLTNRYRGNWTFQDKDADPVMVDYASAYEDTFGIRKQLYNFHFKVGYQWIYRRLAFECYAGLGVRYRNVTHFDRKNPADIMVRPRHPNVYYSSNSEGKRWTASVPANMRIGWTF